MEEPSCLQRSLARGQWRRNRIGAGVVGIAMMQLPANMNGARKTNGSFWHELGDGFRALAIILFLAMVLNFALAPVEVILPIFVKNVLGYGSEGLELLMSAFGVGMVAGSIVIGIRAPQTHRGIFVFALTALGGILFAGVGLIPVFAVTFALTTAFGFLIAVVNTALSATMQGLIADEYRGRVFSLDAMISMGLMPIAFALAGGLADIVGAGMVFVAGGVLTTVASLARLLFREIRTLQ
jgi:predicted MFS family arabinose efflux permease